MKGYISCKFLDYKILLFTFLHYDDQILHSSLSTPIEINTQESHNS